MLQKRTEGEEKAFWQGFLVGAKASEGIGKMLKAWAEDSAEKVFNPPFNLLTYLRDRAKKSPRPQSEDRGFRRGGQERE